MGAGIDPKLLRKRKYHRLKRIEYKLNAQGIPCKYKDLEVQGNHFVVYFAGIGPASNGESFSWLVLRFNPNQQPEAYKKSKDDVDYTDFHTRTIPEHDKGGYDAGVQRVKDFMSQENPCSPTS